MNEEWRPVDGFDRYEVSSTGRVRHARSGRIRTLTLTRGRGYPVVHLRNGGADAQPIGCYVHHLVARAFIGPRPHGYDINHRDGDKRNNRLENLEYCTRVENNRHARATGLHHQWRKLEAGDVLRIKELADQGNIPQWRIGAMFGITQGAVSNIKRGKRSLDWAATQESGSRL